MPELPEVETVRRGLEPAMGGQRLLSVETHRSGLRVPFPENMQEALAGRVVTGLGRRAKYLLIHFSKAQTLVIHLGMSGRMLMVRPGEDYSLQKHDHMVLTLEDGLRVILNDARRFGMVYLMPSESLPVHPAFAALGPEPLDNGFSAPVLAAALHGRKSAIKAALLDQRIVAGLGNIYVCEALYRAEISPFRPAGTLSMAETESLTGAIREILKRAIDAGGSSLKDYRQADGVLGYFQHQFAVYDRAGQPCSHCHCAGRKAGDIEITKAVQQGRSTFYCPVHQL